MGRLERARPRRSTGRRPSSPTRKIEISRRRRSSAISSSVRLLARTRSGTRRSTSSPKKLPYTPIELDEEVVEREPDRAAPVRVAAEHVRSSTRPARSRSWRGGRRSRGRTGASRCACGHRAQAVRREELVPRRTAARRAGSTRSTPTTPSSSCRCPGSPRTSPRSAHRGDVEAALRPSSVGEPLAERLGPCDRAPRRRRRWRAPAARRPSSAP